MKITIIGIGGVGKGTTTKILAEKLGYETLSAGNFFRNIAKNMNIPFYEFVEYAKEHPEIDLEVDKMQEEYGKNNDNFILEGRTSWYFVPDSFKIKLVCDEEERIRRVKEREGEGFLEKVEQERRRFENDDARYKKLFGIDVLKDSNFDLIVDTTTNNPEQVVEIILNELRKEGLEF